MSALAPRLRDGPCLLLDGGMGTQLMARGLAAGRPPELWNADRPADVVAVHRAYVEAGSEAVHTNTFGGNSVRLAAHGLGERARELNTRAVEHARAAAAGFVLGDVGPTGQCLPPVGDGDEQRWLDAFAQQGATLSAAGVDGFHVETMTDAREAAVALRALREAAPHLPVLVSLAFDRRRRGFFTVMGDAPAAAWRALLQAGAAAVGANCGLGSAAMRALADEARAMGVRAVLQPNAGQPEVEGEGVRYAQDAGSFADDLAPAAAHCAALGGCCGTTPAFVAALARRLREPLGT